MSWRWAVLDPAGPSLSLNLQHIPVLGWSSSSLGLELDFDFDLDSLFFTSTLDFSLFDVPSMSPAVSTRSTSHSLATPFFHFQPISFL